MPRDYFGDLEEDVEPIKIEPEDYTGHKFSSWIIVRKIRTGVYECQCQCGRLAKKEIGQLKTLKSQQCFMCYRKSRKYGYRG